MKNKFNDIEITINEAKQIVFENYQIDSEIKKLDGELDFNFLVKSNKGKYVLKVSRPDTDINFLKFQNDILLYLEENDQENYPRLIKDHDGSHLSKIKDKQGSIRYVRLLTWVEGRVWTCINPISDEILINLGEHAGTLTKLLQNFDHEFAHRNLEWDITQYKWVNEHLHLFYGEEKSVLIYFITQLDSLSQKYNDLRKSVVHNDVNDNNIIVSNDLINPKVISIIDFGDSTVTQSINDLAITIAYAAMNKPDPLSAATKVVQGYYNSFKLNDNELEILYTLVAIRLVISVTKSAINKINEPENDYLLVSEKPAWELLKKWKTINKELAYYSFRNACGTSPNNKLNDFREWCANESFDIKDFFPSLETDKVKAIDLGLTSKLLGHEIEYNDLDLVQYKIKQLQKDHPKALLAGGYLEIRPFYSTDAFKYKGNAGDEYRTAHLGIDIWVDAETPLYSVLSGKVFSIHDNANLKDYGPTLILEHETEKGLTFYSLYGHLSKNTLELFKAGDEINKGDLLGYIGNPSENGGWAPHLHFQIMLDMLDYTYDFPGVANPNQLEIWKSICPDPNILFKKNELENAYNKTKDEILEFRKEHLGKSLSVSYAEPLHIVRGSGVHLIDENGQKYLDTVNNVAHVGHEHPRVVKAGQDQMSVLNTNTRYLNNNINEFAEELLSTFPMELSVVHFVNSGSEANELALRMAKAASGAKDFVAVEIGYHGNTSGCIDISSYKFDGKGGSGSPEHTHIVPLPDTFRGLYSGVNAGEKYADHVREQVNFIKSQNKNVAGFICESIISCGGQIELPQNYLKEAYRYIREAGGVCIADEVQVGCGRVGSKFWGFELHNVIPDIVTIGKPIGNGHPLAAVVCSKDIAEKFANGMEYFNTFGGNPVSCAIGLEVLKVIKDEGLQENAFKVGTYLNNELNEFQKRFPIIGDVRGQGLFLGIELVDENRNPLTEKASYLANRMKDLKVLMSTDGKDNNALKIKPPITFSKDNADELLSKLNIILTEDYMKY